MSETVKPKRHGDLTLSIGQLAQLNSGNCWSFKIIQHTLYRPLVNWRSGSSNSTDLICSCIEEKTSIVVYLDDKAKWPEHGN